MRGVRRAAAALLEDGAHGVVGHRVRVQVDLAEALHHLEQQAGVVELGDRVVEVELLDHLPHVGREALDVVAQVVGQRRRVGEQAAEVVERGVVEGEAGLGAQQVVEVVDPVAVLGIGGQHRRLGRRQHAVEAPQHGQRQDDVLVLAALEGVAQQVGDAPQEADDL